METYQAFKVKKNHKKLSKKAKWRIVIAVLLALVVLCFFYYFKVICPIVVGLSEEKVRSIATASISTVVGDVMADENTSYDKIVHITRDANDKIELIEIDTVQVNLLIREVTRLVQEEFDKLGENGITISLGTFTGIPFLFGYGPDVNINLVPVGSVQTNVQSSFVSAGINQTLHRLYFVVSTIIGMVLPGMTQNFTTNLEVLLCESVIVGEIPEIYLQGQII